MHNEPTTDNVPVRTLKQLVAELKQIKKMGFVPTVRAHDGGVGNTLERLLNVPENNLRIPDIGEVEIKAKRIDSNSKLSLLSKSPLPRGVNKVLFNNYSHVADDGIRKLYTSIFGSRINPQGFNVEFLGERLSIGNKNKIEAYWLTASFFKDLETKANKILLAYAETTGKKGNINEKYHYTEVYLLSGLSMEKFKKAVEEGKVMFDIRIGADKNGKHVGKYHDHGTAIRIGKQDYLQLFNEHIKLDID